MRQTSVFFKFVVALLFLSISSAYAGKSPGGTERWEAHDWLRKIQTSAEKLNYSGTFVYQQGSQVRTSRITHFVDGRDEIEKLEVLDGKLREYIRKNDEMICYVPDTKTMLVERRVTHDIFPAVLAADPEELAKFYTARKGDTGRIAGRDCQAIILDPKDRLRYGYKFCADRESGLLLRAQTLRDGREVVEQISFTEISIGNIDRRLVKPSFHGTQGWRVENAVMSQVNLSNWTVKDLPPGFRKIHELKRLVTDATAPGVAPPPQRQVSQIVFSDGLAAISVFIEPGSRSRTEGSMQQGAMNIIGKRHGDFWLTIVGEVPVAAIRQVANSIEFNK